MAWIIKSVSLEVRINERTKLAPERHSFLSC